MKNIPRTAIILLVFTGLAGAAWGATPVLTLKAGYFSPTGSVFRDVYGGGMVFGGEATFPLSNSLHFWGGVELFGKKGLLVISEEETKVRIVPLYAGLRAQFGKNRVRPYIGAAAAYLFFHEENPLGSISDGGLGLITQAGILAKLGGVVWLDVFAGYRACTLRSDGEDPIEAKLDGFSLGMGLVFRF